MHVVKKNGTEEQVSFSKIHTRIERLAYGLDKDYVDTAVIAQKVVSGLYPGITTSEINDLAAQTAAYMSTQHPDFSQLAARIAIYALHKRTESSFSKNIADMRAYVHPKTNELAPLIAEDVHEIVMANATELDEAIDYTRDLDNYDYFGFKTLERSYLLRMHGAVAERPQQMLMRVAVGIHKRDIAAALQTYELMSQKWFTHASPTMFNAGTPLPQCSSCFLMTAKEDSVEGIFDTLKETALISKSAGGLGLSLHTIRGQGSYIKGTGGEAKGLVPLLRVVNQSCRFVEQGGGKRKGSIAVYMEPWHPDILAFLDLKKNTGAESERARDLFYALWLPDLFMRRVRDKQPWSLLCPSNCPGLADCHGEKFDELYERYEKEGRAVGTVDAQQVWFKLLDSQMETGMPYVMFKDACNAKSNQQHLGTIKSSNLCTEIVQYSSPEETAVCNLASIALPRFVKTPAAAAAAAGVVTPSPSPEGGEEREGGAGKDGVVGQEEEDKEEDEEAACARAMASFDFQHLFDITVVVTNNLNKVIDGNYYPVPTAARSNFRHRPIGLGVQGLADTLLLLRLPFDSPAAARLNSAIFETLYFASLTASNRLAMAQAPEVLPTPAPAPAGGGEERRREWAELPTAAARAPVSDRFPEGVVGPYWSYVGSPISRGLLQFDLWREDITKIRAKLEAGEGEGEGAAYFEPEDANPAGSCGLWDWAGLRAKIRAGGVRNSLLLAPMPTASTAQILGNNESFEPFTSNIFSRRVLAGEFPVVNKHLIKDLIKCGVWTASVRNAIIAGQGSVQQVEELSPRLRRLYRTVWEVKQRVLIDQAADRARFIDQSQSFNLHIATPTFSKLSSAHFYSWGKGLKTGMYYLRSRPKADAIQFTVDQKDLASRLQRSSSVSGQQQEQQQQQQGEQEEEPECLSCGA